MSTRTLDSSPPIGAPTTVLNAVDTGAAYIEPDVQARQMVSPTETTTPEISVLFTPPIVVPPPVMSPVQIYQSPQQAQKSYWAVMFLIGVVIVAVVWVAAWKLGRQSADSHNGLTDAQTKPNNAPSNEGGGTAETPSWLVYPGATLSLTADQDGKSVHCYSTDDPFQKVRDWYKERLPDSITSQADHDISFNKDKTFVLINGGEATIRIWIYQK